MRQHVATASANIYAIGLLEGSDTWQLIDELIIEVGDVKMSKTTCDSFYQTDFQAILDEKRVTAIVITGCVTEFCVGTTIRSTVSKIYNTAVISDRHTTGDRDHLDAKSIIEHHRCALAHHPKAQTS